MNTLPLVLFWLCALWGIIGRPRVIIYLFFCSMPFGSFAVIPPTMTNGLTFTPSPILAVILVARVYIKRGAISHALYLASRPDKLMLLFLFWITAAATTIFMPRIFQDKIMIIPMRHEFFTLGQPLEPSSQNISQFCYLTISVGTVFAFSRILGNPITRIRCMSAMIAGASIVVITGILDVLTPYFGMQGLLEPFRTASYALLTDAYELDNKRVVGLMPEASSYGSLVLGFLSAIYFFRYVIPSAFVRLYILPILLLGLATMLWFSTSSSAYIGFAFLCIVAVIELLWRASRRRARRMDGNVQVTELIYVYLVLFSLILISMFWPSLLSPFAEMVDRMVFQKSTTDSFAERSMWTAVSWQAFLDSYGMGVGLGGTRASNGVVAVISNTGLLGGVLYFAFIYRLILRGLRRRNEASRVVFQATVWAFLPPFANGVLVDTSPDFGLFNAFLFGLASALVRERITSYRSLQRLAR